MYPSFKKVKEITKNADGEEGPGGEDGVDHDGAGVALLGQPDPHHHGPQHLGQLGVGQGQRPQPEVGGCVGDGTQHVLDRVDSLERYRVSSYKWPCDFSTL